MARYASSLVRRLGNARAFLSQAGTAAALCRRGKLAQLYEAIRLKRATGLTAREYFHYDLYRPELTFAAKCEYLTRALHERYLAILNPPEYGGLVRNKAVFARYFAACGLPLAPTIGVFHPCHGETMAGCPLQTYSQLAAVIHGVADRGIVCKPVQGGSGDDVQVFERAEDDGELTLVHVSGDRQTLSDLAGRLNSESGRKRLGYLIQERVAQHPILAAYNPATLHTARVVTLLGADGEVRVVGAALKIGLDRSGVESLIDDNLCVPIDWPTGRLGKAAIRHGIAWERLDRHPHNSQPIAGVELPFWKKVQEVSLRAALAARPLRSIGWDIGIAEDGPVLIEGNEIWGEEILQVSLGRGIWTPKFRQDLRLQ